MVELELLQRCQGSVALLRQRQPPPLGGVDKKTNGVFVKILVKPLINLIWLAGFVFVVGCVITLWPDAREEKRLAERYGEAGAMARA